MRTFWKDNGFNLAQDRPEAGVIETEWAENRAKLPNDFIRSSIGRVFEYAYSTSELDKFRTRVERTPTGSDIYISHRGMEEKYIGERKESTVWQPRPTDPSLEAEFLARLMVKLGAKDEEAKAVVATAAAAPAAARRHAPACSPTGPARPCRSTTASTAPGAASAWRSTAAASRSRTATAPRACTSCATSTRPSPVARSRASSPSCSASARRTTARGLAKYRVKVTAEGSATSTVAVLDSQGKPESGEAGKRIVGLLLDDLK